MILSLLSSALLHCTALYGISDTHHTSSGPQHFSFVPAWISFALRLETSGFPAYYICMRFSDTQSPPSSPLSLPPYIFLLDKDGAPNLHLRFFASGFGLV